MDLRPYIIEFLRRAGMSEDKWQSKANALGVAYATLHQYLHNQEKDITLSTAEAIIASIGGDLSRALPDWHPEPPPSRPSAPLVIGSVDAKSAAVTFEQPFPALDDPLYGQLFAGTKYTRGGVAFVRVVGDQLEPRYSNGTLLAMRERSPKASVIDGSLEVVTEGPHKSHLLRRVTYGSHEVVAESLTTPYGMSMRNIDDVHVTHIVVGAIRRS